MTTLTNLAADVGTLSLTGTASTNEVTRTCGSIALNTAHTFYFRMSAMCASSGVTFGMYWPIAEPGMDGKISITSARTSAWQTASWTSVRNSNSSWTSGTAYSWRVDFNNYKIAAIGYIREVMIIDLTVCFGSGSEPTAEWMDRIPFFTGSKDIILPSDVSRSSVSSISLTPNPVSVGASVLVSVGTSQTPAYGLAAPAWAWTGTGPYTQSVTVTGATADAYVLMGDPSASVDQRNAEYAAVITGSLSSGVLTLTAHGVLPTVDIPLRLVEGPMPATSVSVPVSSWSGSGPWIATVTIPGGSVAVAGPASGSSASDAKAIYDCGIHVSAVSGKTCTLRAMYVKPTAAITVGIAYF